MSNIDRVRPSGGGPPAAPSKGPPSTPAARPAPPAEGDRGASSDFPSVAGTAVLNLTVEQRSRIRKLLIAMRLGRMVAQDVRGQIFAMLTGGQRRVIGAAWFILSVRV